MSDELLQVTVGKFIFRVKPGCMYTEAGVWAALDDATDRVRVGLTDFRQQSSGDVVFVRSACGGTRLAAGEDLANIETIKVDMAVPSPAAGEVTTVNEALDDAPELINQDPYGGLAACAEAGALAGARPRRRRGLPGADDGPG